ncbi:hypothetical protein [Psychroflexus sediminis]|uniref:Uncharacterized protein n=1 Tax=Psychroflexus sediminis TaxID=470826 RepID=A0A1G7UFI5_9FLAO|nr:hypothetical protein [Psychroflexus sediminis]SDG46078.1 hypothetical protein SAMN04488027_10239 [Psychroflexus sediminis]
MQQSKDYLEREIEKLSLMLISLIEKVTSLNSNSASDELNEIDTTLHGELDLNLSKISEMQEEEFLDHISSLHLSHIEHLSELLYRLVLKMDSSSLKESYDYSKIAKKAILLIDVLDQKSKTFSMKRLQMKEHLKTFKLG